MLDLSLNSRFQLRAGSVHAQRTYGQLLEGLPSARINERVLAGLADLCATRLFMTEHVVIPPIMRMKTFGTRSVDLLPAITVAVSFRSTTVRDHMASYSALAVVWFQDELEPLISPVTRERLVALDWAAIAHDYED